MARKVPEWVGRNDDTSIPDRVKARIAQAQENCCANCGKKIAYGGEIDHITPIILWVGSGAAGERGRGDHGNRESNLQLLCKNCHQAKTKKEVKEKAKDAKTRLVMGPLKRRKGRRGFRGWRKMNGEIVWRKDE